MAKTHLKVVTPTTENRTVTPKRCPNAELHSREHLTAAEVEQLVEAAGVGGKKEAGGLQPGNPFKAPPANPPPPLRLRAAKQGPRPPPPASLSRPKEHPPPREVPRATPDAVKGFREELKGKGNRQ